MWFLDSNNQDLYLDNNSNSNQVLHLVNNQDLYLDSKKVYLDSNNNQDLLLVNNQVLHLDNNQDINKQQDIKLVAEEVNQNKSDLVRRRLRNRVRKNMVKPQI